MNSLKIIYGKEQVQKLYSNQKLTQRELKENVKIYIFNSEEEKIAFINGLEEALGWSSYFIPELEIEPRLT